MAVLLRSKTTIQGLPTDLQNINNEITLTQTGAGLNTDGSYDATGNETLISGATSLKNADNLLAQAISDVNTSAVQSELDTTQTGAGLDAGGTYTADGTADYIDLATSLKDADIRLDSALKSEETSRISGDALSLKKASNLGDLTNTATARTNLGVYSSTEVDDAINTAGLALGTNFSVADIAARDAMDSSDLSIGDNVFVTDDGDTRWAIYKVTALDTPLAGDVAFEKIMDEDVYLNAQSASAIKTSYESNADTNAYTDEDQSRVGRIGLSTTLLDTAATKVLPAINELHTNISTLVGHLDTTQAGAGLGTDGSYLAPTGTTYLGASTSLKDADSKLDAAIVALDADTYSQAEVNTKVVNGGAVFITETLNVVSDAITVSNPIKDGVIFNFSTVRHINSNGVAFDIEASTTVGGTTVTLSPDSTGEFDDKNVMIQYSYKPSA